MITLLLSCFVWLVVCEEARRARAEIHEIRAPFDLRSIFLLLRLAPVIFYTLEGLHLATSI